MYCDVLYTQQMTCRDMQSHGYELTNVPQASMEDKGKGPILAIKGSGDTVLKQVNTKSTSSCLGYLDTWRPRYLMYSLMANS